MMDKPNRIIYKKLIRGKFPWYSRLDLEYMLFKDWCYEKMTNLFKKLSGE